MSTSVTEYGFHNQGLFVLGPPRPDWEQQHGPPTLDVVAVHGLNGECFRTWTTVSATGERTMWLSDLLLPKLPRTRVMTFGYNASVAINISVPGIRDNARRLLMRLRDRRTGDGTTGRPIVFVGHNLGGIIIKQALRTAVNETEYRDIADSSRGIVFFGTPHRGGDAVVWGSVIAANITAANPGTRFDTRFTDLLKFKSEALMDVSEDFRPIATRFAIKSFVEQDKFTHPLWKGGVVVDKFSAVLELPHEEFEFLPGNHSTIVQFARDPADLHRFDAVWMAIERVARGVEDARAEPATSSSSPRGHGSTPNDHARSRDNPQARGHGHGQSCVRADRPRLLLDDRPDRGALGGRPRAVEGMVDRSREVVEEDSDGYRY